MRKATNTDGNSLPSALTDSTATETAEVPTVTEPAEAVVEVDQNDLAARRPLPSPEQKKRLAVAETNLVWRVYRIRRRQDGKTYVGITKRDVAARVAAHQFLARRHPEFGRPGSLAHALREADAANVLLSDEFEVDELEQTTSAIRARELEREWVARLDCRWPRGFNVMPGGSSLGGPVNAVPVSVNHPRRGRLQYGSIFDAVDDTNRDRAVQGKDRLDPYGVYARLKLGWPVEEALELAPHADGRRKRAPFLWRGRTYDSLADLAAAEGLPISTIRSRLHRARIAGCDPDHDASKDRRRPVTRRAGGVGCGRKPALVLPHPDDPETTVSAKDFARLTGVPAATVRHRWLRLTNQRGPDERLREQLLTALTVKQSRRVRIALELTGGRVLNGGVHDVVWQVLANSTLSFSRDERIGASAIRRRLRRIPGWPNRMTASEVRWAFGFEPTGRPGNAPPLSGE